MEIQSKNKHAITHYAAQEIIPVMLVSDENAVAVSRALVKYGHLMSVSPGSSHNHQAWKGGYVDHVRDTMVIATELYRVLGAMSRLPFELWEAHEVLFLHDIEKPVIYQPGFEYEAPSAPKVSIGQMRKDLAESITAECRRKDLVDSIIADCGFTLSDRARNALRYIHGENDDYSGKRRVMNELAGFCHMCDIASARVLHSYGKGPRLIPDGDNYDVDAIQPVGSMDIYSEPGTKVRPINIIVSLMLTAEDDFYPSHYTVNSTAPGKNRSTVTLEEVPGVHISTKLFV